jgi:signal transduction histidine kinase
LLKSVYNDVFLEAKAKQIDFEIEIDKDLKWQSFYIDEDKIKQVFINLISNAIKFTNPWWKVVLKATKLKNKVLFEIIDNGIWIPKERLKDIFNKFTQVESSMQRQNANWIWIGLALCKSYIEDFGSKIEVKSELGKWSNFNFELKLAGG